MNKITETVKHLLIINVIFFIAANFGNFCPWMNEYFPLYAFGSPNFHWYQMLTHMFMHANVSHIFFNMFGLYSFGIVLEHFWGSKKFLFFYISCGLGAALMNNLVNEFYFHDIMGSAVGASGAIYGLLVAFAFMFPNAELGLMFIPIPIKAKYFVPIYMLLYDGFFGIFGTSFMGIDSGVAHFAHIGGALTGFIMMWFWKNNKFTHKRWN
jgi:membrane associated rhomboid family serine protease